MMGHTALLASTGDFMEQMLIVAATVILNAKFAP